jgi:hypothetical protein
MKLKIMVAVLAVTLIGGGLFGVAQAFAQTPDGATPKIVQKIAQKFGLKESDVQAVFDKDWQERQSQREAKFAAKLSQLVQEGKITEAQKQLILQKHQELETNKQAKLPNLKNLTPEQRKTQIQSQRQALDDWAKQNGIDPQYLFGGFGLKGHRH